MVMGAAQYDGVPSPDLVARLQDADDLWRPASRPTDGGDRLQGAGRPVHRGRGLGIVARRPHGVPPAPSSRSAGTTRGPTCRDAAAALHERGMTEGAHRHRRVPRGPQPGHRHQRGAAGLAGAGHRLSHQGWSTVPYFAKETVGVALGRIIGYSHASHRSWGSLRSHPFGGGVIGNTAGSGPVIGGSSPPPRANAMNADAG